MSYDGILNKLREEMETYSVGGISEQYISGLAFAADLIERDFVEDEMKNLRYRISEMKLVAMTTLRVGLLGVDGKSQAKLDAYNDVLRVMDELEKK